MNQDVDVYTETMAEVYADQGHWEKVADIYRRLLATEPERLEYAEALAEAESKLKTIAVHLKASEHLVPLFREWIELLFKFGELQKLKKLKKDLNRLG